MAGRCLGGDTQFKRWFDAKYETKAVSDVAGISRTAIAEILGETHEYDLGDLLAFWLQRRAQSNEAYVTVTRFDYGFGPDPEPPPGADAVLLLALRERYESATSVLEVD